MTSRENDLYDKGGGMKILRGGFENFYTPEAGGGGSEKIAGLGEGF